MAGKFRKVYLGDGAYADYDGFHVVLTTENGVSVKNRICLDPQVIKALISYLEEIYKVKITTEKLEGDDCE